MRDILWVILCWVIVWWSGCYIVSDKDLVLDRVSIVVTTWQQNDCAVSRNPTLNHSTVSKRILAVRCYNVSVLTCVGDAGLTLVQLTRVEHNSVLTCDWLKSWWNSVSWDVLASTRSRWSNWGVWCCNLVDRINLVDVNDATVSIVLNGEANAREVYVVVTKNEGSGCTWVFCPTNEGVASLLSLWSSNVSCACWVSIGNG